MPRYLLRIAYDGTAYVGWQRQANGVSIQQRLEEAAEPLAGVPIVATAAGRTDAGVHALAQAVHLDLPDGLTADVIVRALNSRLPADIRVREAARVADDFHARFSASTKTYRYRWLLSVVGHPLLERDAWRVAPPLNVEVMQDAAARLVGTHDFAGLQSSGTAIETTVRTVTSVTLHRASQEDARALGLLAGEGRLQLDIAGSGFLRHMVRAIAGTLTDIGRGRWPPARIDEILAGRDRGRAGPTAPAQGLTLVDVRYPSDGESFPGA